MVGVRDYSLTAGDNATVDGTSYFPEGQAPSSVNDAMRFVMRDAKEVWELQSGTLTTGGSANAQTLTPTRAWTEYTDGDWFSAVIGNSLTNTGSATMNVSGLGTKTIYKRDGTTALSAGDLAAGSLYTFTYDAGINGFRLESGASTLDDVTSAGSDVASAGTIDLTAAKGGIVDVTGTTTITAVTLAEGDVRLVRFTGALTFTHGASLVLPGAANITTAAGDWAILVGDASSVVRCVAYQKANGTPVAIPAASQAEMEAASSNVVAVTPGRTQNHPGVAKAWVKISTSGGTVTVDASHNVTSVTDNGVGDFTINFTTAFADAHYVMAGSARGPSSVVAVMENHDNVTRTTSAIRVYTLTLSGVQIDPEVASFVFFGDQ